MFAKLSKEATKDENGLPAVGPSAVPSDTREGGRAPVPFTPLVATLLLGVTINCFAV